MTDFLLLAFIFLIAGVIAVPLASRLGLGSVLGYLIAGIVISPILTALHVDVISIQHFAEFGVVMMLFLVGMELEPHKLWGMRARLLGLGGGQVGLTTALITGAAMIFGLPWQTALAVGLILALSSTAIVLQTLNEKGLMKSDGGQASFSVLLFQDIAVIPMLALLPLLAMPELADLSYGATSQEAGQGLEHGAVGDHHDSHAEDGDGHGPGYSLVEGLSGWQTTLVTLAAIGFVVFSGSYLTRPLFRFIASAGLRELFTAAALLIVIGIALLMTLVGLSPALGTFVAGVVLANSEYRHELEADINPFRGLLLGLFFMTVGAGVNFSLLFENIGTVLGLTLGLMIIKSLVLLALAYIFKLKAGDKWLFGTSLAQAGEFGFVLLSFAVGNAILPDNLAEILLLVVALSMLLTPALFIVYERILMPRLISPESQQADQIDEGSNIIIAGVGRIGGIVNHMLRCAGHSPVVVDFNSSHLETVRTFGLKAYFGDATRPDLLEAAGIRDAKLFIIAIDGKEQITQLANYIRKNYPDVHVIARAVDRNHVYDLYAVGCRDIIRETFDSAVRIGRSAFEVLGSNAKTAQEMATGFVKDDQTTMILLADAYDPEIPFSSNEAYIDKARALLDIYSGIHSKEPGSFGKLEDVMKERGEDIPAIIARYNDEITTK